MKRKNFIIIAMLIGVLLVGSGVPQALQWVAGERSGVADDRGSLIRLHIIANSDDPGDQEMKYEVRDRLIAALRPELLQLRSRAEAEALLAADRGKIAGIAEQVITDNGYSYPARVEIGDFAFPDRTYGNLVLPAGDYRAVRIVLGQGAGANWWCVLFPPLCFVDISGAGIGTGGVSSKPPAEEPGLLPAVREDAGKLTSWVLAERPKGTGVVPETLPDTLDGNSVKLKLKVLDWLQDETARMAKLFSF
jgi:stage II sporulation protein R